MSVKSIVSEPLQSQLLGYGESHVVEFCLGVKMHQAVADPLRELIEAAQTQGFDLRIASGFRHFDRQRLIWNKKCLGQRPVLDQHGQPIEIQALSPLQKIQAILRWSALPGASRHHWGTECDIYDMSAMPEGYQLQLHPSEYQGNGLFAPMMQWLEEYVQRPHTPDFYRPYTTDKGGVAPEPWHLSYRPVARRYERLFSKSLLAKYLQRLDGVDALEEQAVVLDNIDSIYTQFIALSDEAPQ